MVSLFQQYNNKIEVVKNKYQLELWKVTIFLWVDLNFLILFSLFVFEEYVGYSEHSESVDVKDIKVSFP